VLTSLHKVDHLGEAIEARSLHRPQWIRREERHHSFGQIRESSDAELFAVTVIRRDLTTSEKLAKLFENEDVPLMLHHAELWKDLPANFHRGLPVDADEEASLSIDKADHPAGAQAFLLIVCTGRIVTQPLSTAGFPRLPSI
jgi:hypothetical protein